MPSGAQRMFNIDVVFPLRACLVALLLVVSAPTLGQERTLDPVDEGAKDPSWVSFKNRLLNAVAKRDRKFVASILHPGVRSGMQGGRGVAEFRKQWEFDSESSPLWQELGSALFLGSAWAKREKAPAELCSPYVAVKWPQDVDAYSGGAIIAKEALVKAAPSADAATVATMSYNVVVVADWEIDDRSPDIKQKWVKIKIAYGEAYVPEEQVRSPIEHTACFVRVEGGWRLIGFGPGGGN